VELHLIRQSYHASFSEDIKSLDEESSVPKGSPLKRLIPYLDPQDRLLRAEGRLHNAPVIIDTKHPIILDAKSKSGHLIIADGHNKLAHGPLD